MSTKFNHAKNGLVTPKLLTPQGDEISVADIIAGSGGGDPAPTPDPISITGNTTTDLEGVVVNLLGALETLGFIEDNTTSDDDDEIEEG